MANLSNNLFYYATKELSQDAFICWLCSFALEDSKGVDEELTKCAKKMICKFLEKGLKKAINEDLVFLNSVEKQVNNIDVLLSVNYEGQKYKIIVEDKVYSSERNNQLERYMKQVKIEEVVVLGIYFKTGFQSDYTSVEKAGYVVFDRKDLLSILKDCNTKNNIFIDYYNYWYSFEEDANGYSSKVLSEWNWKHIYGFYNEMVSLLKTKGFWAEYGYVSNPSGGFRGLWYGKNDNVVEYDKTRIALYLQTEIKWVDSISQYDYKICLKIDNQSNDIKNNIVHDLKQYIIEIQDHYGFKRPKRVGSGKHITIGVMDKNNIITYDDLKSSIMESLDDYIELLNDVQQKNSHMGKGK